MIKCSECPYRNNKPRPAHEMPDADLCRHDCQLEKQRKAAAEIAASDAQLKKELRTISLGGGFCFILILILWGLS